MKRRLSALGVLSLVLILASISEGAVSLTLVPRTLYPHCPLGETVNVDVFLVNEGEGAMRIRLIQLDLALSDPRLEIGPVEFDTSSLVSPAFYSDFSSGSVANLTYTGLSYAEGFTLEYGEGPTRIATFPITLPERGDTFTLDVANGEAPDINSGAVFQWDFENTHTVWSGDGTLGGGHTLLCIPEPASALLLMAGACAVARRRSSCAAGGR